MCKEGFSKHLNESVRPISGKNYPPREHFKSMKPYQPRNVNQRTLAAEFRLRSGHNRLRRHLSRLGMEKTPKCRFCDKEEDGYHLLFCCQSIPDDKEIRQLRQGQFIFDRQNYHEWLFCEESRIQSRRHRLIEALWKVGIKI